MLDGHQRFLSQFQPMFHFYTPWKHQKTSGFTDVFRGYRSGTLIENGLMFLQDFLNLIFFLSICRYIFRITVILFFSCQRVYYIIACHLSKIHLQSKRKAWFYTAKKRSIFYFKNFQIFIQKKELFPENCCSWNSKMWKETFNFSKIFEK